MKQAIKIILSDEERAMLNKIAHNNRSEHRQVVRAKIVLLAAEGKQNIEIAADLGISRQNVARWRDRYSEKGISGIMKDAPRGGRPTVLTREKRDEIVNIVLHEKPQNKTQWSVRTLAERAGATQYAVYKILRSCNIRPHKCKKFQVSTDPNFADKVRDICGLYLNPPEHAVVLSVDEKTQIQALDRTQKCLPLNIGYSETMTHDYRRNGVTSLFAAINCTDGYVYSKCHQKHTHKEWLSFLKHIDRNIDKSLDIHIICDNYATHKTAEVKEWLAKHDRFHIHFTPTHCSWLNVVERFFAKITNDRIRRGTFRSVKELEKAITNYITENNENPKAFRWVATAEYIIGKAERAGKALKG